MLSASTFLRIFIIVIASAAAFSTLPARSEPAASDQQAQPRVEASQRLTRANRVCCRRNWQNWWTTRHYCDQTASGRQVANRECRNNWNDRWDSRWWGWEGGTWNSRVCCRQGARDRWTNARDCRDSAGFPTATRFCSRAF
jgi:hypothetical protein